MAFKLLTGIAVLSNQVKAADERAQLFKEVPMLLGVEPPTPGWEYK